MGGEANPTQFNNKELALPHSIEKHGYAALYKSKEHLYESGAGAIHHTTSLFEAALDSKYMRTKIFYFIHCII